MKTNNRRADRTAILTVRVPVRLKRRLEGLAKTTATNRSRLAVDALEGYVDEQEAQLAKIDRGIRDAHEKVKRYLQSWGSKRTLPPPRCK
jgi:predicted transcriptional regulator